MRGLSIQTFHGHSAKPVGTVLIAIKGGRVEEVVSDLHLDVQVMDLDSGGMEGGYSGTPSRPLWDFLRKLLGRAINAKSIEPESD